MGHPIGIFDSGIGGFTIYQACVKRYPHHSFVLLADQMHLPYGDKTKAELLEILDTMLNAFRSLRIKTILIACNTMSSLLDQQLRSHYADLNLLSIIEPTLSKIPKQGSLMILATQATLNTGAYQKALLKDDPNRFLVSVSGRQLAKLIEDHDDVAIQSFVTSQVIPHQVDHIVLACTHYPLITHTILQQKHVNVIDSIDAMVDLVKDQPTCDQPSRILTTADPYLFSQKIARLFHEHHEVALLSK